MDGMVNFVWSFPEEISVHAAALGHDLADRIQIDCLFFVNKWTHEIFQTSRACPHPSANCQRLLLLAARLSPTKAWTNQMAFLFFRMVRTSS
jgi:hypothetical protein